MAAIINNKQLINEVAKTLMISSGKGGVGKSTIAANLAVGLARQGLSIGLLDLDVFGPTIPRLMGIQDSGEIEISDSNHFIPTTNYGVKCMSMGLMTKSPAGMIAWRGLMVMKAIQQLLWNVKWGPLDILVIDMPPGTGDTHITVCQQLQLDGAIVVTTPQKIALEAAEKGLMLLKKLGVPILGLIENMKRLKCPACNHDIQMFPDRAHLDLSLKHNVPIIGSLPMKPAEAESCDRGRPTTSSESVPHDYSMIIDNVIKFYYTKTTADRSSLP